MDKIKPYCTTCNEHTDYEVRTRKGLAKGKFPYLELYGICKKCGEELYVPAIADINAEERFKVVQANITRGKDC